MTIAEQFEKEWESGTTSSKVCVMNAIERIEARINEFRTTVNNQGLKQYEISNAMCGLEERITALEHPVQQAGEWRTMDEIVWRAYFNPSTKIWTIDTSYLSWIEPGEYWMPIIPGMKKPDPPEVDNAK